MHRVRVLSEQVTVVGDGPAGAEAGAGAAPACPMRKAAANEGAGSAKVQEMVRRIKSSGNAFQQRKQMVDEIRQSGDRLLQDGTWPMLTLFDAGLTTGHDADVSPREDLAKEIKAGSFDEGFQAIDLLPGPWRDARTMEEQVDLLVQHSKSEAQGYQMFRYMELMQKYGDNGLSSNIVVPATNLLGVGSKMKRSVCARVILGDPQDAERISRVHTRKEGNFCPVLYDSLIATTDNEHWQAQRRHLVEAFLPLSSLAEILPKSLDRARGCAERLAAAAAGGQAVDMNDFLLHEAQAQLQLALLGCPEAFMEATNQGIRATFMGEPGGAEIGTLSGAMQDIMARTTAEPSFALPSDGRPVSGPLSRAVGTSELADSANFGNMLLILFAGHDTTGHTMTWMLFELARHPDVQQELQREVDAFFAEQGGRDPTYRDLSRLSFMDRCITETLRLWPAVANGTFRRLQFDDTVKGPGGKEVLLPKGTAVQIANWPRHRNAQLWGADADSFNPRRAFAASEVASVGCPMAAVNPQSERFSPFAHAPRSCLGRNFAQMEMRLIMLYLLRRFDFKLAPPYDQLMGKESASTPGVAEFRGINRGTMGPMNLDGGVKYAWGQRHTTAMQMFAQPRA